MKDRGGADDDGHQCDEDDDDDVATELDDEDRTDNDGATKTNNAGDDVGDEDQWEPLPSSSSSADGGGGGGGGEGGRPTSSSSTATAKTTTTSNDDDDSNSNPTIINTVPSPSALRGQWARREREGSSSSTTTTRPSAAAAGAGRRRPDESIRSFYQHPRSHRVTFGPLPPASATTPKKEGSVWIPALALMSFLAFLLVLSLTAFRDVGGGLDRGGGGGATEARVQWKKVHRTSDEGEEEYLLSERGEVECGLYLYGSSVAWGGSGLWGVFAARRFEAGDVLFHPGISLPLGDDDDDASASREAVLTYLRAAAGGIAVIHDGVAPPKPPGDDDDDDGAPRGRGRSTATILPHLAMLVQPHPTLHNVERRVEIAAAATAGAPSPSDDDDAPPRSSGHVSVSVVASRRIAPGEEIFFDATTDDAGDDLYPPGGLRVASGAAAGLGGRGGSSSVVFAAPLAVHYGRADVIARDAAGLAGNPNARGRKTRETKVDASYLKVLKRTVAAYDPATASLLPETHDDLMGMARRRHGGGGAGGGGAALASLANRTVSWLDRHGRCIDNIRPGGGAVDATSAGAGVDDADAEGRVGPAGRGPGAFAVRFIPRGGLVTTAPVYVIPNGSRTEEEMTTSCDEGEVMGRRRRRDPWLDHCFGHDDSSAVICPSSYAVLINHDGWRSPAAVGECEACNDDGYSSTGEKDCRCEEEVRPNTKYEWSAWNKDNIKYVSRPLTEGEVVQGMSIDFIATRDILPGEEIFIDNGEEWHRSQREFSSTCCAPGETSDQCRPFRQQLQMNDSVFPARWKLIQ